MSTAYISDNFTLAPTHSGTLSGLTFAVKDVIAISGRTTGLGNPTWLRTHKPARQTAPIITELLRQGAMLCGITITDEFMFSVKGDNHHYGAPLNPAYPNCYCGGSSAGSASAVAQGDVDFALGTDTGGSIRVPASHCDLYGLRPTWQPAALTGVAPLAPSLDTVGILAKDPAVFTLVGSVLQPTASWRPKRAYTLATTPLSDATPLELPADFNADALLAAFQRIQGYEAWHHYGSWLAAHQPHLGADIRAHFEAARQFAADDKAYYAAKKYQRSWRQYLNDLLADAVLELPTSLGPLPLTASKLSGEQLRYQTQRLTSLAGLAGCPQVTIPDHGYGRSFIGPQGSDAALITYATQVRIGQH
ncbi:amidase family protein [Lacticaseibacillus sp. GG6-2]